MRDTVSSSTFDNDPYAKPQLPANARYIELDDFSRPGTPVLSGNGNLRTASAKRRSRPYFPNTLWTRAFFITVIIETIATVAIETYDLRTSSSPPTLQLQTNLPKAGSSLAFPPTSPTSAKTMAPSVSAPSSASTSSPSSTNSVSPTMPYAARIHSSSSGCASVTWAC
jgi:hypothetical protein